MSVIALKSESFAPLSNLQLQKIIATPGYPVRVLACEPVAGDDRNPVYAYIQANEDGDYQVVKIRLTRTGLASQDYRVSSKPTIVQGIFQTLYEALEVVNMQRQGKFRSVSGPPPLSSAMFSLNEFGIEPSPLIDGMLAKWNETQQIAPLRYAVYNQPRNEIEVSFVDPSAHNDEEHQLQIKKAIEHDLGKLFDQGHILPNVDAPAGRYTRRPINNRTHNMIISLNLNDDSAVSESAPKKHGYKFAKVSGKAELVLPSSKRAGLTEIKTHLKKAKSDRTKALRLTTSHATVLKQAEAASTPERKKTLKAKAKTLKGQVSALNKSAKASLTTANKAARSHGLGGLNLPISTAILSSAKKLASAKTDVFGAEGKRGQFKPKFTTDAKFEALGNSHVTKAAKKAPAASTKKPGNAAAVKRTKQRVGEQRASGTLKPKTVKADPALKARADKQHKAFWNDAEIELSAEADKKLASKVEKRTPAIMRTVGVKADLTKDSGSITGLGGNKLDAKSADFLVTEMRNHFEDKKIPVIRKKNGFEIPGVLRVTHGASGAKFQKVGGAKKPKAATAAAIDKALPGILNKIGFKFNVGRDAGLVRNLKGGKIAKSNEGIAEMRDALAKKFDVQDTAKGFEIPGLLEVKTGPTGVVIVRPDRYDKANDPALRVKSV